MQYIMSSTDVRNIIIIGGGIIGCTTAYYLTEHPEFDASNTTITIIEASVHGVARGASGKAGGLVAKWAYPKSLVNVSYPEHIRLAEKHKGAERWGWRLIACGNWEGRGECHEGVSEGSSPKSKRRSLEKTVGLGSGWKRRSRADMGLPDDLTWVKEELTNSYSPMAPKGHTAQVQPYLFTTSMLQLAQEQGGVQYVSGKVTSINTEEDARSVTGVTYSDPKTGESATIPATHVILAAGPWSAKLIPSLPINATRAHSIVIRADPSIPISPYVLFTEITFPPDSLFGSASPSPEIYVRPKNEVYCCGTGDNEPLPETVDDVTFDNAMCDTIYQYVAGISPELRAGKIETQQACYLPTVSAGGDPIIGEATSIAKGLIIATGHTCWGISNAPGTAKAISELIMNGKILCADLDSLSPERLM